MREEIEQRSRLAPRPSAAIPKGKRSGCPPQELRLLVPTRGWKQAAPRRQLCPQTAAAMGVEGCTKCIKYLLFVFNFVFWLAGGIILGVALWLRHDSQTTNILYLHLGDKQAPNTFYIGIYILIAVGAVMMFVGFLGCYGAIQESQCLLGTFFTCLVILFACEVAAGIWGFVNKDLVAKDVKQFYDQALQQALQQDLSNSDATNAKTVVKTFHETLDCCGANTIMTISTSSIQSDLCPKEQTLLETLAQGRLPQDCHKKIDELFSEKLYLIGVAAIVVAVIMIFEMILSMILCCGIRNSTVY